MGKTNADIHKELRPAMDKLTKVGYDDFTIINTPEEWELYEEYTSRSQGYSYYRAETYGGPAMTELPIVVTCAYQSGGCQDSIEYKYLAREDLVKIAALLKG